MLTQWWMKDFYLQATIKAKEFLQTMITKVENYWGSDRVFSTFKYLQLDEVKKKLNKIVKDVWVQFQFAESVYNKKNPNNRVQLADHWIEWIKDYYAQVEEIFVKNI
ncbi:hypothetical protein NW754_010292 [Fusarium falciforme]|nr:hypothetical protein NW754_010292 [Fusarium falciforme]